MSRQKPPRPYERVSSDLILDARLTEADKRVLLALELKAGESRLAIVTVPWLTGQTGLSQPAVSRALKKAEELGYVRSREKDEKGRTRILSAADVPVVGVRIPLDDGGMVVLASLGVPRHTGRPPRRRRPPCTPVRQEEGRPHLPVPPQAIHPRRQGLAGGPAAAQGLYPGAGEEAPHRDRRPGDQPAPGGLRRQPPAYGRHGVNRPGRRVGDRQSRLCRGAERRGRRFMQRCGRSREEFESKFFSSPR